MNIFVGMGLLSMPYAMKLSGWLGLLAMAALTALFCLSGKLIVRAFDKMPSHQPHTYPALGNFLSSPLYLHACIGPGQEIAHSNSRPPQNTYTQHIHLALLNSQVLSCDNLPAGYHALGDPGRYAVATFALLEFFGGSCMMLIIMWRILTDTLPALGMYGLLVQQLVAVLQATKFAAFRLTTQL